MDKYSAIMAAADFIERNPERYNFYSARLPRGDDDRVCLLGWAGHFMGMKADSPTEDVCEQIVGHRNESSLLLEIGNARPVVPLDDKRYAPDALRRIAALCAKEEQPPKLDPALVSFRDKLKVWKPVAIAASLVLALFLASPASAATLPAVTCSSATNQAVCVTPQVTLTIPHAARPWTVDTNGTSYTALNPPVETMRVLPQSPATYDEYLPPTVFVAADGSTITVTLQLHYYLRAVSSGRVHYVIEQYTLVSGSVQ